MEEKLKFTETIDLHSFDSIDDNIFRNDKKPEYQACWLTKLSEFMKNLLGRNNVNIDFSDSKQIFVFIFLIFFHILLHLLIYTMTPLIMI